MAIGVFKEESLITVLAISVIIHKIPLAFTVGATFESSKPELDKYSIAFYVLFILTTPVGVAIGMAIGESNSILLVVIQGLSGGIFIYLAMCDLLIHEFHQSHDLPKLDEKKRMIKEHMQDRKSAQMKITVSKFIY